MDTEGGVLQDLRLLPSPPSFSTCCASFLPPRLLFPVSIEARATASCCLDRSGCFLQVSSCTRPRPLVVPQPRWSSQLGGLGAPPGPGWKAGFSSRKERFAGWFQRVSRRRSSLATEMKGGGDGAFPMSPSASHAWRGPSSSVLHAKQGAAPDADCYKCCLWWRYDNCEGHGAGFISGLSPQPIRRRKRAGGDPAG